MLLFLMSTDTVQYFMHFLLDRIQFCVFFFTSNCVFDFYNVITLLTFKYILCFSLGFFHIFSTILIFITHWRQSLRIVGIYFYYFILFYFFLFVLNFIVKP